METSRYACVFWSKDESDEDLTDMAQRGAHVPGVTDTASNQRKNYPAQVQLSSLHNKQKLNMQHTNKKKEQASAIKSSMKSENQPKNGKQSVPREAPSLKDLRSEDKKSVPREAPSLKDLRSEDKKSVPREAPSLKDLRSEDKKSVPREAPSLKDLRSEDKKRVANLIRVLAKTGEEKEVAKEQLEVERRENEIKTKQLQSQIEAILDEREDIQQQYLECQKLLSSYQSKVSEEQRNLSESLQDGPLSQKEQNDGWFPIKESIRSLSPTSDRPSSKAGQQFMELQSVSVRSSRNSSHPNGEDVMAPPGPRQTPYNHHGVSERQFNPVLSSTHRPHHRSRVPSTGMEDMRTARNENKVNGFSSTQTHGLEQSKQSDFHHLSKAHGSQREGSIGVSQETFLPMTEVIDESRGNQLHSATKQEGREQRKSSDRNSWVSLPEMDGQFPGSYELHKKELRQNDTSLPTSLSDANFSRQRPQFEEVATFQHDINHQTRIQPDHKGHSRNNRISTPKHDVEAHEERQDYHSLTPEQRQRQLGSLKKKLQQEQGWLQQKLQEQERLLHRKQLEIQRQKQQLSQLDDTGYEQVRRRYLVNGRTGEQHTERTGVADVYRTELKDRDIQENGYHYKRLVPEGGKEVVTSPWQQHGPCDEEVSTKYPPDNLGERYQQEVTGQIADDQFGNYNQRHIAGYNEDNDINYPECDEEEVEGEETWYEMREETEGADSRGSIQGYASFHPQQGTRKQGATDPGTSHIYQSYHTSGLRHNGNGSDVRLDRGYPSRIREPQRQFGNITSLLEEEGLTGISLNGSNPPYTRPRTRPRPDTTTNPKRRVDTRPHQSNHSNSRHQSNTHSTSEDPTRERDRVTIYTPQSQKGLNGQTHPTAGKAWMDSHVAKRPDGGSSYLYTEATRDDALHSHLVQRSHKVIQEIGMLLNQSAEMREDEESKVLEDVFFLK